MRSKDEILADDKIHSTDKVLEVLVDLRDIVCEAAFPDDGGDNTDVREPVTLDELKLAKQLYVDRIADIDQLLKDRIVESADRGPTAPMPASFVPAAIVSGDETKAVS